MTYLIVKLRKHYIKLKYYVAKKRLKGQGKLGAWIRFLVLIIKSFENKI